MPRHGHPIAREMERWHKEHNGDHESPEWHKFVDEHKALVEDKSIELTTEHSNDSRFGMSKAGGCTRAAALKLLDKEPGELSGSSLFTFWIGHQLELAAVATLRLLGYKVEGTQEPVRIDPFMHSFSDGIIRDFNDKGDAILSVKSTGYKKSGKERRGQKTVWVRRGFPELPFEGVKTAQPSWWAQAQAEMHGSGIKQTLLIAVAKDIIKAMEEDPYLGEGGYDENGKFIEGNGSLTFYAELLPYDGLFVQTQLLPTWQQQWAEVQQGNAGPARFFNGARSRYVNLKQASLSWTPNATETGTFNPCLYCEMLDACNREVSESWKANRAAALNASR